MRDSAGISPDFAVPAQLLATLGQPSDQRQTFGRILLAQVLVWLRDGRACSAHLCRAFTDAGRWVTASVSLHRESRLASRARSTRRGASEPGIVRHTRREPGTVGQRRCSSGGRAPGPVTKPPGSLGRLESIGLQLSGIARTCPPPDPEPVAIAVFAGDHGVVEAGVTPWPSEVTAQMVANFCAGGAAINVLARHIGARVVVIDVGVASPIPTESTELFRRNVARGTTNLATGPAMTEDQALATLEVGAEIGTEVVRTATRCSSPATWGLATRPRRRR